MVPTGRPGVVRLWTTKPPELAPYGIGEEIEVVVTFSEPVAVKTNGTHPLAPPVG